MTNPCAMTARGDVGCRPCRPRPAGWPARASARRPPSVPTTPPVRLSKTDSIRIIRTTAPASPADRPQNADLVGPLEDRHHHRVQHADGADHQGHGRSDPGHGVDELDFGGRVDELGGGRGFDVLAQAPRCRGESARSPPGRRGDRRRWRSRSPGPRGP